MRVKHWNPEFPLKLKKKNLGKILLGRMKRNFVSGEEVASFGGGGERVYTSYVIRWNTGQLKLTRLHVDVRQCFRCLAFQGSSLISE